jgi:hypothetical protein
MTVPPTSTLSTISMTVASTQNISHQSALMRAACGPAGESEDCRSAHPVKIDAADALMGTTRHGLLDAVFSA